MLSKISYTHRNVARFLSFVVPRFKAVYVVCVYICVFLGHRITKAIMREKEDA